MNKQLTHFINNKGVTVMTSKSIILPLIGAALLSIAPAIGQTQATKQAEPKKETMPSRVVLHSMRAKRLHANHVKGTSMTKGVKKEAKATAKSTKQQVTPSKKMVRKVSSKAAKGKASSSMLVPRTKHASHKHPSVKKSSTNS